MVSGIPIFSKNNVAVRELKVNPGRPVDVLGPILVSISGRYQNLKTLGQKPLEELTDALAA